MTEEELKAAAAAAEAAKKAADEKAAAEAKAKEEAEASKKNDNTPSDNEAKLLKEVMQLKEKLKDTTGKLTAYEGIDPEVAKKALADAKAAETKKLEEKGHYDLILKSVREENEAAIKKEREAAAALQKELEEERQRANQLSLGNAFGHSKFIADNLVLTPGKAQALYGSHFEMKDGQLVAYDKPTGTTNRAPLVDAKGSYLPFEAAIEKIVKADSDWETIAKNTQKPGANSKTNDADNKKSQDPGAGIARISAGLLARNQKS
jgi:hypothetical protein